MCPNGDRINLALVQEYYSANFNYGPSILVRYDKHHQHVTFKTEKERDDFLIKLDSISLCREPLFTVDYGQFHPCSD